MKNLIKKIQQKIYAIWKKTKQHIFSFVGGQFNKRQKRNDYEKYRVYWWGRIKPKIKEKMQYTKEQTIQSWTRGFWTFLNLKYLKQVFIPMIFTLTCGIGFAVFSFLFSNETLTTTEKWAIPIISLVLITASNIFIGVFVSKVYENKLDEKIEKRAEDNITHLNNLVNNLIRSELLIVDRLNEKKGGKSINKKELEFIIKDMKSFQDNTVVIMSSWKDVLSYSNANDATKNLTELRNKIKQANTNEKKETAQFEYEKQKNEYKSKGVDSYIPLSGDTGTIL